MDTVISWTLGQDGTGSRKGGAALAVALSFQRTHFVLLLLVHIRLKVLLPLDLFPWPSGGLVGFQPWAGPATLIPLILWLLGSWTKMMLASLALWPAGSHQETFQGLWFCEPIW